MKKDIIHYSEEFEKNSPVLITMFNNVLRYNEDAQSKPLKLEDTELVMLIGYEQLLHIWEELKMIHAQFKDNILDTRNFIKKIFLKQAEDKIKDKSPNSYLVTVQDIQEYSFFLHSAVNGSEEKLIDIMIANNAKQTHWDEAVRDIYQHEYNLNNLRILNGFVSSNPDEMLNFLAFLKFNSVNIKEIVNLFLEQIVKFDLGSSDYINIAGMWKVSDFLQCDRPTLH